MCLLACLQLWIPVPEKERAGDADANGGKLQTGMRAYLKIVSSLRISFSSPCILVALFLFSYFSSRVLTSFPLPGLVLGGLTTKEKKSIFEQVYIQ